MMIFAVKYQEMEVTTLEMKLQLKIDQSSFDLSKRSSLFYYSHRSAHSTVDNISL